MTDDAPTMGRTLWNWLASGDDDAEMWTRFVRHYYGPLVRWAYSTLRPDRAAAETVAEDVLLSVRRRFLKPIPVRLNRNRSLRSYLWRCVTRLALKRRLKACRHHDRFRALTLKQCDDLCTAESRHTFQRSIRYAEWLNTQALTLRDSYRHAVVGLRAAPQFSETSFAAFVAHYGRGESFLDLAAETGEKAGTVARNARRFFARVCLLMGLPIVEKRDKKRAEAILRLVTHDDAPDGI